MLRAPDGRLGGVHLIFPARFRLGEQRLLGLGSCSFFVEPHARLQGFFLFRRFLQTPDVDFFFATTCNEASGALWRKLGGEAVPDSEATAILIQRPGPVAEELALRRRSGRLLAAVAGGLAHLATPLLELPGRGSHLELRPCCDWDQFAWLAERHRDAARLTAERSAAYLAWRYTFTANPPEVLAIREPAGPIGWVTVSRQQDEGSRRPIRRLLLLDLIADRARLDYRGLFRALRRWYAGRADLLTLPGRIGRQCGIGRPLLWLRSGDEPAAYILDRSTGNPSLAGLADLSPADGDADG
jgi:hypothetical protein